MKKVLTVIAVLAIVASFSSTAYATEGKASGFWNFMTTFMTGKGLDPNCTSINGGDPLRTAVLVGAMQGNNVNMTDDKVTGKTF